MNNIIEYKNYTGTVEYSAEDNCLHGKIAFISDLITYEANSVDELKENFKSAVNEYLETCQILNRAPQKAFKGKFSIRTSQSLHEAAAKSALKLGLSLNAYINNLLEVDSKRLSSQ